MSNEKLLLYASVPSEIPQWFNPSMPEIDNKIMGPGENAWWNLLNKENQTFLHNMFLVVVEKGVDARQYASPGAQLKEAKKLDFLQKPSLAGVDELIDAWWNGIATKQQEIQKQVQINQQLFYNKWQEFFVWKVQLKLGLGENAPDFVDKYETKNGNVIVFSWK